MTFIRFTNIFFSYDRSFYVDIFSIYFEKLFWIIIFSPNVSKNNQKAREIRARCEFMLMLKNNRACWTSKSFTFFTSFCIGTRRRRINSYFGKTMRLCIFVENWWACKLTIVHTIEIHVRATKRLGQYGSCTWHTLIIIIT